MKDADCLFCKIIDCEVPSEKVFEDAQVYAFKDINPKAKVHVLVVPRDHYRNVDALAQADPALLAHMVEVAQGIADDAYNGSYRLIFHTGVPRACACAHRRAHGRMTRYLSKTPQTYRTCRRGAVGDYNTNGRYSRTAGFRESTRSVR